MKKSAVAIILVIFAAGCMSSQPVKVDASRGLTISSFTVNPVQVFDNEPVIFDIEVENIGGTTARNAQLDFYGVENQWRDTFGNMITDTRTRDLGTIRAPEPFRNIPGQKKFVQVQMMPPDLPSGLPLQTLRVEARVSYDYNTSGFIDIPAISDEELRRRQINGETIGTASVSNSAGPIHMDLLNKNAIIVDTVSNQDTEWPLTIVLTNVGDGFPITPEDNPNLRGIGGGRITGTIDILGPAEFSDCLGATGRSMSLDNADITVRIKQDKTARIGCTIRVDENEWNNRPMDSIKLVFNLFYRYYVNEVSSVQVSSK